MTSVIIPALNEEQALPHTIISVRLSSAAHEIIVVDAGSDDKTIEVATALGAKVLHSNKRQRAAQLNLGAAASTGNILLFLHADTLLPALAIERINSALESPSVGGGAFSRVFQSPSLFLRFTCLLAEIRGRALGWHLGDQAIFVRKEIFDQLNGFRPWDSFEDLDFSRRLARCARTVTLRPPVVSSARRFIREGPVRRTLRDVGLTINYLRRNSSESPPGSIRIV